MKEDDPVAIAGITPIPYISRREETAKIAAAVMTVGNPPEPEPAHYDSHSIIYVLTTAIPIIKKNHLA